MHDKKKKAMKLKTGESIESRKKYVYWKINSKKIIKVREKLNDSNILEFEL